MMPISWILPRARAMFPDRPAIVDGDVRHTFEQLGRRVDALVGGLKIKGVTQGDRVAILDVNSSTYAEAYYACAQAGVVLVPLNSRLAAPELRYILNDAGAKVLLVSDAFFPILEGLRDSLPTVEHVLAYGKGPLPGKALDYEAILKSAQPESACATVDLGDVAQIYYTSGTTGEPKGVCLTYRNMIASAFDSLIGLGLNDKDIWLHGAPMFHLVDAWSIWAMPLIGAPQVTLHYTPEDFMRTVQATRATATGLPPTLISMMANHPKIG
ncbi:MAG: AMP-binding protein, partial [Xanthobacteraceae bacterium]